MVQADAVAILNEVYAACSEIFPCGIHDAYLYGSYARGNYHDSSDVDIFLAVDLDWHEISDYRRQVSRAVSDLSLKHDVTVSVSVNPLAVFVQHPELPYYQNVRREGIRHAGQGTEGALRDSA